jgi:hypothetical protein
LIASVNDALRQLTASADSVFAQSGALHKTPQPTAALPPAAGKVSAATMSSIRALQQLLARQDLAAMQSFESLAPDLLAALGPQTMESLRSAVHSLDFATAARTLSIAWPEDN